MHTHSRYPLLFAAVLGVIAIGTILRDGVAASYLQPPSINRLVTTTTPLTEQQRTEVSAYAEYWINQLATGEPEAIRNAVRALDEPLNRMGLTRVFRDEYSRAALPRLEALLAGDENFEVAMNATKVAAFFNTEGAIRFLVDRADPAREPRPSVRLWAARGFRSIVESNLLDSRQLSGPTRDLVRAAESETNWLVLQRHFEALAAVPESLTQQLTLMRASVRRMLEDDAPNPSMQSLYRALVLMRDQWLNIDVRTQQSFGASAGPEIVRVLELVDAHWDKAHEEERPRDWYRTGVQAAETLLLAIDPQVRPNSSRPQPGLAAAFQRRDRDAFQSHVQTWRTIVGRDPYARAGGS